MPAICSVWPLTILNFVVSVKSANVSPANTSIGKCSSAVSCANWPSTARRATEGAWGVNGASVGGTSSSSTRQSPGWPAPATMLWKFVGGRPVGVPAKSNRNSAALANKGQPTSASVRKILTPQGSQRSAQAASAPPKTKSREPKQFPAFVKFNFESRRRVVTATAGNNAGVRH